MIDLVHLNEYSKIIIGYSGGPDSQALVELTLASVEREKLCLVHINHGISDNADEWEEFCRSFANVNGVEFHAYRYDMKGISNLESYARDVRYGDFAKHYDFDGKNALLTGHHQDDQVETFFLSLMRGAGIDGLACMPEVKQINNSTDHIRPLLSKTKEELIEYLNSIESSYVIDESNADSDYNRNFFRNEIIPKIRERFPNLNNSVAKSIDNIQKAKADIDAVAKDIKIESWGSRNSSIRFKVDGGVDLDRITHRKAVIKRMKMHGIDIGHATLDEVQKTLFNGPFKSGYAMVEFGDFTISGNSSEFYVVEKNFFFSDSCYSEEFESASTLQNSDYIQIQGRMMRWKKFCESRKVPLWVKQKIRGLEITEHNGTKVYQIDEPVLNHLCDVWN